MVNVQKDKQDSLPIYKMSENERLNITNQLKEAIEVNKANDIKNEWQSDSYRDKYGL